MNPNSEHSSEDAASDSFSDLRRQLEEMKRQLDEKERQLDEKEHRLEEEKRQLDEKERQLHEKERQLDAVDRQFASVQKSAAKSVHVAISYDAEKHPESIALSRITSIGEFLPELWQTTAAIPHLPQAIRARMHSDIGDVSAWLSARSLFTSDIVDDEKFLVACDAVGIFPVYEKMRHCMVNVTVAEFTDYIRYVAMMLSVSRDELTSSVESHARVPFLCSVWNKELLALASKIECNDEETAQWLNSHRFYVSAGGGGSSSIKATDSMLKAGAKRPHGGTDLYFTSTCLALSESSSAAKPKRTARGTVADICALCKFKLKFSGTKYTQQALAEACFCTSDNPASAPISTYALLSSEAAYQSLFVHRFGCEGQQFVYHASQQDGLHSVPRTGLHDEFMRIMNLGRMEGVWRAWLKSQMGQDWWYGLKWSEVVAADAVGRHRDVLQGSSSDVQTGVHSHSHPHHNDNDHGSHCSGDRGGMQLQDVSEICNNGSPSSDPQTAHVPGIPESKVLGTAEKQSEASMHPVREWLVALKEFQTADAAGGNPGLDDPDVVDRRLHGVECVEHHYGSDEWDEEDEAAIQAQEEEEEYCDYLAEKKRAMDETAQRIPLRDCEIIASMLQRFSASYVNSGSMTG